MYAYANKTHYRAFNEDVFSLRLGYKKIKTAIKKNPFSGSTLDGT